MYTANKINLSLKQLNDLHNILIDAGYHTKHTDNYTQTKYNNVLEWIFSLKKGDYHKKLYNNLIVSTPLDNLNWTKLPSNIKNFLKENNIILDEDLLTTTTENIQNYVSSETLRRISDNFINKQNKIYYILSKYKENNKEYWYLIYIYKKQETLFTGMYILYFYSLVL